MTEKKTTESVASQVIALRQRPADLNTLIDIFRADPEQFYQLACAGVASEGDLGKLPIARLAAKLQGFLQRGYQITANPDGNGGRVQSGNDVIPFEQTAAVVTQFLGQLNGTAKTEKGRKDYRGEAASEAEVSFALGDSVTWQADKECLTERMNAKPLVLRLDEQDRREVTGGMPHYITYGLRHCATRLVQTATVMYRGLRRQGALQQGYAFCGRLPFAYDNKGERITSPPNMIYVVYVTPDGLVFDWDWVKEDPNNPGYPIDPELRFCGDPEPTTPEAVLIGVDDISPTKPFNSQQVWHSAPGDCIFCYFSDEFAYADRIDNDLTVFRSVRTNEPTGFKIKNYQRIVEDEKLVQLSAPDLELEIEVLSFLFASSRRNPTTNARVYGGLGNSWVKGIGHANLPKITIPPALAAGS